MNILVICSNGMSTSLIVSRMRLYAIENQIEANIKAISIDHFRKYSENLDYVLLAPQIAFYRDELNKAVECPVRTIVPIHYGKCDGESILKAVLKEVKKGEKYE